MHSIEKGTGSQTPFSFGLTAINKMHDSPLHIFGLKATQPQPKEKVIKQKESDMQKIPSGTEPAQNDVGAVMLALNRKRTDQFSEKELRLMIACFRKGGDPVRALLAEFDAALDKRIKLKLGLVDAPESGREITE